ncbi:DUF3298 and DUF4163 domain-containing protein [Fimbriimonas ginsengisoli]|uniref:DUF3298 domain-containing protein n=1 Tax=Fimbriimonas ginsengisoli Gsoil 348 TaxID=661478 RepID=A0A068NQ00_FIMGI|nr:DUF3298 and DUF4163 domain-containing protein [Fimbriimonas ginsengisoli]AIE84840.1 hypothetical protein OP10G_1472 [Fimbriimonas ginsengisoli Gsoil 348]
MLAYLLVAAQAKDQVRIFRHFKTPRIEVTVKLPKLGGSPADRAATAAMERFVRVEIDRMQNENNDPDLKGLSRPFYLDIEPVSVYRTNKLVSVSLQDSTYSGGAHGMTTYSTFTYGPKGRMLLSAFFRKGAGYVEQISFALMNQLRTMDRADWVQNGEIRGFKESQLRDFVVRPGGVLRFYFAPYELGSFASGPFEIDLSRKELADRLP